MMRIQSKTIVARPEREMNTERTLADTVRSAPLEQFVRTRELIRDDILRAPLLPYAGAGGRIRLKAECLQPLGSFKIRAAASALQQLDSTLLGRGVATASAGNFAQGLAQAARRRGVALTVHVPDSAARVKVDNLRTLGARVVEHSFADWWQIMSTRDTGAADGTFIHPVCEPAVIFGNGTIGLELADDWPELDTVVVPFGGGGLSTGIALALKARSRSVRVIACEVETSTPLAAAFAAGKPVRVERQPSFVDGIGSNSVLDDMWPLLRELIDQVIIVKLADAERAVRDLVLRHHIVAEGAGAVALAGALSPECQGHHVAAIISGGNIDAARLCPILTAAPPTQD
jgi:threonine dehydratase